MDICHDGQMNEAGLSELSDHLGRNLRAIRKLRGLTQQQLADLCEIPRSTVANAAGAQRSAGTTVK